MNATLPTNWESWRLADTGEWRGGGTPSSSNAAFWNGDFPWVSPKDMKAPEIRSTQDHITAEAIENSAVKLIPGGSVLFVTRSGILAHSFPVATTRAEVTVNQDLKAISPVAVIHHHYLAWALRAFERQILSTCSKHGTTVHSIEIPALKEFRLPIPPPAEQSRIVAKIEELFSELDKGVESLTAAREQLKVYRQAVLKHAFEGKLTAQWREKNKDKLETPDQLLARIDREHEARYKRQLSDWHGAVKAWEAEGHRGNKPVKPQERGSLHQLNADELALLPTLPNGYVYTYLANLGDLARGKSKHRPRNDPRLFGGEYPFIQTGEVKAANRVIREYSQTYNEVGLAQSHLWPKGTLCITIAANIAQTAFLGFDACFPDSVVGFSPFEPIVLPEYVELFIKAVRVRIEAYAPATAQKNINLTTLANLVVPYCSLDEQRRIVGQVEALLSVVDENDAEIEMSLLRCTALRQAILKKAFCGQLVTQDPNDEPASVLLERIRAEGVGRGKGHKNNKRKDAA